MVFVALILGGVTLPVFPAMRVQVVEAGGGTALADATVTFRVDVGDWNEAPADAEGRATIATSEPGRGELHVLVRHAGHVPLTMHWPVTAVPGEFTFRLSKSQRLAGQVIDELGGPVSDALVTLVFPQRLAGPWVPATETTVRTDRAGAWQCDAVPQGVAYVRTEVTHPDYDPPEEEFSLEALRSGTVKHQLFGVVPVVGRITDEAGAAVAGARVSLGPKHGLWPGSRTLETTTTSDGGFEIPRVRPGEYLLGIKSDTAAPLLQLREVKRDPAPLEIRLERGAPLRVRVMDDQGHPVSGAKVAVEEWPAERAQAAHLGRWSYPGWEWVTDAAGRMIWPNAPLQLAQFSISKGGYMRRSSGLRPRDNEQVIELGPVFRVSGSVVDDATGEAVPEIFVNARFVETYPNHQTNVGRWSQYVRKRFSGGRFSLAYESPLLAGTDRQHDWQFLVEAPGYAAGLSRVLRDAERGAHVEFRLQPTGVPDIPVEEPSATRRIVAGLAFQPSPVSPGELVTLYVRARVAPGYHIYALDDSGSSSIPTAFELPPFNFLEADGPWRGPEPKLGGDGARTLAGDLLFHARFVVGDYLQPSRQKVPVRLRLQVCNEAVCWPPETIQLETELNVVASRP